MVRQHAVQILKAGRLVRLLCSNYVEEIIICCYFGANSQSQTLTHVVTRSKHTYFDSNDARRITIPNNTIPYVEPYPHALPKTYVYRNRTVELPVEPQNCSANHRTAQRTDTTNTPTVATSNAGPSAARNAVELLNEVADGSPSPTLKRHDPRHSDKMNNKIVSQSRFLPRFHCLSLHFYLLLQIKASPWPLLMLLPSLLMSPCQHREGTNGCPGHQGRDFWFGYFRGLPLPVQGNLF
jgi:hypothetical protein